LVEDVVVTLLATPLPVLFVTLPVMSYELTVVAVGVVEEVTLPPVRSR
jgi:hypothetical protein